MEIILGALAQAIFSLLIKDLAQRPGLAELREKLRGPSPEKLALQRALTAAYIAFSHEHPSLAASFFDEYFLRKPEVVGELSKLLTPNQIPSISVLERTWQAQFHGTPQVDLQEPLSYFLDSLEQEIKAQPLLKPFRDSRAFEQLYAIAQRNQEQVAIQEQMRDLLVDIRSLLEGIGEPNHSAAQHAMDAESMRPPSVQDALIDFLLRVPAFQSREDRDALLFGLDDLSVSIPRSNVPVTDIIAIVKSLGAVGQFETGEWPLVTLMRNAQRYCAANTDLGRQLKTLLAQYENS